MPRPPTATTELGRRILAAMESAGIEAGELAKKLDVSPGRVAQYLRATTLHRDAVGRIATALGCDRSAIDPELAPASQVGAGSDNGSGPVVAEFVGFDVFAALMRRCSSLERAIKAHRKATGEAGARDADRKLWAVLGRPKAGRDGRRK